MFKATVISMIVTFVSMCAFSIANLAWQTRGKQIGLGALLAYTVYNPLVWYFGVTIFFLAFRYFMRRPAM